MPEYKYIPIEQLIEPPSPIRVSMDTDALTSLAESIKEIGVLQPLLVVALSELDCKVATLAEGGDSRQPAQVKRLFEIVAGHRRYKACIMANLNAVPCLVFADAEIARHAAMLQENTEREDITPAEEAIFFAELIERYDYTEEQLLKAVKKSASYVYTRLDLLRGNQEVFTALREKRINMAVATQLNHCKDAAHASYLLALAVQGGATAATVAKWVSDHQVPRGEEAATPTTDAGAQGAASVAVADERKCVLCRRGHQPLNLVPVWVHDWELRDLNERMDNAANVDVTEKASTQGA
jgi:ParB family chromosome partitioning protein